MKTTDTVEENVPEGLPVHYIEACLEDLRAARYAPQSLNAKRRILTAFADWMTQQNIGLAGLDESVMAEFMKRSTGAEATPRAPRRAVSCLPGTSPQTPCSPSLRAFDNADHPMTRSRDSPDISLFAPKTRHNPGVGIM